MSFSGPFGRLVPPPTKCSNERRCLLLTQSGHGGLQLFCGLLRLSHSNYRPSALSSTIGARMHFKGPYEKLSVLISALTFSGSAFAADMAVKAPPPPPVVAPAYNWTGCYIGGSAGGTWGNAAIDSAFDPGFPANHLHTDPNGFIGGGQIGCDYQNPSNWLIGLQGEFNLTSAHSNQTVYPPFPYRSETFDERMDWFASATARLGYVSGPWLFYGKGGAAWVRDNLNDSSELESSSFNFNGNTARSGWTVGAGFEYAIAPNWSTSFEYGYYNFGTKSVTLSGLTFSAMGFAPGSESIPLNQNFSVIKAGLNYRFSAGR
jgi:outer membrane immunogenic protein